MDIHFNANTSNMIAVCSSNRFMRSQTCMSALYSIMLLRKYRILSYTEKLLRVPQNNLRNSGATDLLVFFYCPLPGLSLLQDKNCLYVLHNSLLQGNWGFSKKDFDPVE